MSFVVALLAIAVPVVSADEHGSLGVVLRDNEVVLDCNRTFAVEGAVVNTTFGGPGTDVGLWTVGSSPTLLASNQTGDNRWFRLEAETPPTQDHYVYRVTAVEIGTNRTAEQTFHVWGPHCPADSLSVPSVAAALVIAVASALLLGPRRRELA
jgi:hypothetical protein